MKKKNLLIIILIFLLIFTISVFAVKIEKSDHKIVEKGNLNEDYLFKGNELEFSGSADDLYFAGKRLNFTGEVLSSLYGVGDEINVSGKVKNNLMIGAKSADISGEISDTAFITGGNIDIKKTSKIDGALFICGRKVTISGTINGNVMIAVANLTIDGTINGNAHIYSGKINITDNGKINGNLKYRTERELSDTEKSKISGSVEFLNIKGFPNEYKEFNKENLNKFFKIGFIFIKLFILIAFIIGSFLTLLFPIMKKNFEEEKSTKRFWFSMLWGLIPILIYPAIIIILLMFGLTLPLSVIILFAALPLLFLTKVLGVTLFGQYLFNKFKWNKTNRYVYFLFGLIFYVITSFIPFIAFIAMIFFSSLGWGLILEGLFNRKFD